MNDNTTTYTLTVDGTASTITGHIHAALAFQVAIPRTEVAAVLERDHDGKLIALYDLHALESVS